MSALAGKGVVISISTNDSTYNPVAQLNDGSMTIDGDNQDITVFGQTFITRLQGLKDTSYSLSGFRDTSDTNGQNVILTALLNGSALYVKFLYDGTNGFKQPVVVSSFEVSASVDGVVELSIDLEGNGPVTAIP